MMQSRPACWERSWQVAGFSLVTIAEGHGATWKQKT